MARYTYLKKLPQIKAYKNRKRTQKRVGLFVIILGAAVMLLALSPYYTTPAEETVLNPIPFSLLAEGIQTKNVATDQAVPLEKYITATQTVTDNYSGYFYISFPTLKLAHIRVKANVDSTKTKEYEAVLSSSVAHFKGTSLPGEGGNTFIYGHSSIVWYHELNPYSYEGVFTALFDLKLGDKITVQYKNDTYTYIVEGMSTIAATDFSAVKNIQGTNILTLMTCAPPGVNDKRLIVRALQI